MLSVCVSQSTPAIDRQHYLHSYLHRTLVTNVSPPDFTDAVPPLELRANRSVGIVIFRLAIRSRSGDDDRWWLGVCQDGVSSWAVAIIKWREC